MVTTENTDISCQNNMNPVKISFVIDERTDTGESLLKQNNHIILIPYWKHGNHAKFQEIVNTLIVPILLIVILVLLISVTYNCDREDLIEQKRELITKVSSSDEEVLIIAGGEKHGSLVNTVEVFPQSYYSSCLPNLPEEVKWGSMGMLGHSLMVCGGQNMAEHPSRECWILDSQSKGILSWTHHSRLIRYVVFLHTDRF